MSEAAAIQMIDSPVMREPRTVAINIRVTEEERKLFHAASLKEDLSLSDWLRKQGRRRAEELRIQSTSRRRSS
jgi:hypothetical protein